jgi:hypothetical protein
MDSSVVMKVVERMEMLPSELQQLVLEFVQTLQIATPQGVPGRQLLQFAGGIPKEDLTRMHQAVAIACEQVNVNEW